MDGAVFACSPNLTFRPKKRDKKKNNPLKVNRSSCQCKRDGGGGHLYINYIIIFGNEAEDVVLFAFDLGHEQLSGRGSC